MADITPPRPLRAEDDRDRFDCGRESLNNWFRRHAWNNHTSGASRVNVMCDRATGQIAGYVTLSAAQIERASLPKARQRNQPDMVPVILLGQLAVDQAYQGQGHATSLMIYAMRTALKASNVIGCVAIITHPLDDEVRKIYARWGFENLPFDPKGTMIVRMVDLVRNGFET